MSELDKEAVLDEFTAAYKKAHGKKPKVEDSNGWYSVDGGKNMRLAQLDEWTQELKSGKADSAKKDAAKKDSAKSSKDSKASSKKPAKKSAGKATTTKNTAKKSTAKKSTAKNSTAKKATTKKSAAKGKKKASSGDTPAQAWQAHLDHQPGQSTLPRGFKAD